MKNNNDNILLKEYGLNPKIELPLIFAKIDELLKVNDTINVAIDGNSSAGKSTLANLIKEKYDCNLFHMDDFFLTPDLKTEERLIQVGGNVDYVRFSNEVITELKTKNKFKYQRYNCNKMELDEIVNVTPKRLNIIEGSYSMHPTLIGNYDLKIFLNLDKHEQVERILKRNGPFMLQRFINEWIPKENIYFEKMNIRDKADLVF